MGNKKWKCPKWLKKYEELITDKGGNSVEELMNNHDANVFTNAPLALICVAVKSQVSLLTSLHEEGIIK